MVKEEIPKSIKKDLETYAPKFGKKLEDMEKEYYTYLAKAKEMYPDLQESKLPKQAFDLLVNNYRRKYGSTRSSADLYEGWIDGASPLKDQVQDKIRRIQFQVKKSREDAIIRGLINEDGVPMDDRATIFGRRKNPNFGRALANAPPTYIRTLYGIGRKKGESEWHSFTLTAFEETAEKITWKNNIPCEFRARAKNNDPYSLFVTNVTQFHPLPKEEADWDMEDIYDQFIIPCSEIETRMNSTNWNDRDLRVKADVVNVNPNPINDRGDRVVGIADMSLDINDSVSCFVPSYIPIQFGIDTKIVMTAQARKYKDSPSLSVFGIYPIPGRITFSSVGEMNEEEVMVGWVDEVVDEGADV